jgi:hypothetical protein
MSSRRADPQPGDWWCGQCNAFNWRSRWRCINCGHVKFSAWLWLLLAALIVVLLALAGCAPRTLRSSMCFEQPGMQLCQYSYEGDETP